MSKEVKAQERCREKEEEKDVTEVEEEEAEQKILLSESKKTPSVLSSSHAQVQPDSCPVR